MSSFQIIQFNSIHKSFGPHTLFAELSLSISRGQKIALVGENGCGKTTLARLMAALEEPDSGSIWRAEKAKIGYLPQESTVEKQSGGEARRAHLASLLAENWDLLILDEPTNHLDKRAVCWLEMKLRKVGGATLLISHDREFLNRVADGVLELEQGHLTYYPGNYDDYRDAKRQQRGRIAKAYEEQKEIRASLQRRIKQQSLATKATRTPRDSNKMSYDARGERRAQSRSRQIAQARMRLTQLEEKALSPIPKSCRGIYFQPRPLRTDVALRLEDLEVQRDGRRLMPPLSGMVRPGDRVVLFGPNGCGKSSLLKILARLKWAPGCQIGYLDQEGALLDENQTPLSYLRESFILPEHELRSRLYRLGLTEDQMLNKLIAECSMGQKRRIQLLALSLSRANVLLLDEPTNHLAPSLIDALEEALRHFPGVVIVATHDTGFAKIATQIWD